MSDGQFGEMSTLSDKDESGELGELSDQDELSEGQLVEVSWVS